MLKAVYKYLLIITLLVSTTQAQAQPAPAIDSLASPAKPFTFSGAVDVYYAYDFSRPADRYRLFTTQAFRHNEFNMNYGYLKAAYEQERVRATLLVHTGTYVQANYAHEPNTLTRLIGQANAGVRIGSKTWLDVGILPSHIGYESTFSGNNEIYTRALMAENSPYYETGASLTHTFSEKLEAKLLVLNGWQNIHETNNAKSFGASISYQPTAKLSLGYNNYFGNEAPDSLASSYRFFNNFNAKYFFTDRLSLGGSFDYGTQKLPGNANRSNWYAGLLVAQYQFSGKYALAARIDHYNDKDQVIVFSGTSNGFQTSSASLNFDFKPLPNTLLRFEARKYNSKDKVFVGEEGIKKNNLLLVSSVATKF